MEHCEKVMHMSMIVTNRLKLTSLSLPIMTLPIYGLLMARHDPAQVTPAYRARAGIVHERLLWVGHFPLLTGSL